MREKTKYKKKATKIWNKFDDISATYNKYTHKVRMWLY